MMISKSKQILIDTNILIYAVNKDSGYHKQARIILEQVSAGEINGVISIQNVLEFCSVLTSVKLLNKPISIKKVWKLVKDIIDSGVEVVYPNNAIIQILPKLFSKSETLGKRIYDYYLVATMLNYNISTIYTVNEKDFQNFKHTIHVVNPLGK